MSGFIGKHLEEKIDFFRQDGVNQTRVDAKQLKPGDILRVDGLLDVRDTDAQYHSKVEILLHLGSFTPKSSGDAHLIPSSFDSLRVTQQLCSGIFPNLKKIIFVSTMDVYKRTNAIIDESSNLEVSNAYVASKLMSEHVIEEYCKNNKIHFDIIRIGHIYGEGDDVYQKVLPNMIRAIKTGGTFRLVGEKTQSLNLLYVDDLIDVIFELVNHKKGLGIMNVVSGFNFRIEDLIAMLEQITGLKLKIEVVEGPKNSFQYNFDNTKLMKSLTLRETPLKVALKKILKEL
jgi:UDP-glucose 4-epimerase